MAELLLSYYVSVAPTIKEIDLSQNQFSDLMVLVPFTNLEVLILDGNRITSHTKFPSLPKLHTLWLNKNKIDNLSLLVDKLVIAAPNLRVLSLLFNEACPYLTGTPSQYKDYRLYILCRLRNITHLDDKPVIDEERAEAIKRYGNLEQTVARDTHEATVLEEKNKKLAQDRKKREEEEASRKLQEEKALRRKKREQMRKAARLAKAQKQTAEATANLPQIPTTTPLIPAPPPPSHAASSESDGQAQQIRLPAVLADDNDDWTDDDEDWDPDDN